MWRTLSAAGMYVLGGALFAMLYLCLCRADARQQHDQQQAIERRDAERRPPRLESQSTRLVSRTPIAGEW